jgi:hypothetical protein
MNTESVLPKPVRSARPTGPDLRLVLRRAERQ